jgi:hypothetical protein
LILLNLAEMVQWVCGDFGVHTRPTFNKIATRIERVEFQVDSERTLGQVAPASARAARSFPRLAVNITLY